MALPNIRQAEASLLKWRGQDEGHSQITGKMSYRIGKVAGEGAKPTALSLNFSFSTLCHGPFIQHPSTHTHVLIPTDSPGEQALHLWVVWVALSQVSQQAPLVFLLLMQGIKLQKWREDVHIAYVLDTLINKGTYPCDCYKKCLPSAQGRYISHGAGPRSIFFEVWPCLSKQCFTLSFSLPISGCALFVTTTESRKEVRVATSKKINSFLVLFILSDSTLYFFLRKGHHSYGL